MEVLEEKISIIAGDMGERRFHRELDFVPLRATAQITFSNGVQPADGLSH